MSCGMQEELLFLPRTAYGRDPIAEPHVRTGTFYFIQNVPNGPKISGKSLHIQE